MLTFKLFHFPVHLNSPASSSHSLLFRRQQGKRTLQQQWDCISNLRGPFIWIYDIPPVHFSVSEVFLLNSSRHFMKHDFLNVKLWPTEDPNSFMVIYMDMLYPTIWTSLLAVRPRLTQDSFPPTFEIHLFEHMKTQHMTANFCTC
jgi:hypothetical protein